MSIIQNIRDKYARIAVIAVALAIVSFILTDYFNQKQKQGGGVGVGKTTVGSVNGTKIGYEDFGRKVQVAEDAMKQQGYPQNEGLGVMAREQTWNDEVNRLLLASEINKLGMRIEKKELGDILYGPNMPADLKQQLTDPKTGVFDPVLAKQQVDQMLKSSQTPQEQKDRFNNYVYQLTQFRMRDKYIALMANTSNYPRWFVEKVNADNSQIARISIVKSLYSTIPDSTVKVDDKEIADYINKHKDDFKQEESRSIAYVSFSAAPSLADSALALKKANESKMAFDTATDIEKFLIREGVNNFYDGYINGKTIQIGAKDSIFKTPVGTVYGPYLDGGSYVLAKVLGTKPMPDTVKIRHILISTQNRDTATAYKLTDSLRTAIAGGANFDTLALKFSDDGTKDKGGIYDNVYSGQMVPTFNDYIFLNPVGSKGIVKTEFGYHYIEILSQRGGGTGYKIAQLPREIFPSEETINEAQNKASQFAADSRDLKTFDDNFAKQLAPKGYQKGISPDIKPTDAQTSAGLSRVLVKNIYKAKLGEVLSPELVGDNYIVAVVTEINKEGTQSVAKARINVEPALRNKKKAQQMKQKLGSITTLEAAAAAWGGAPIEMVDSLRMNSRSSSTTFGFEPKVSGAAFNPAFKGKVIPEAIEGNSGVYVIRVENVAATPNTAGNVDDQRKQFSLQQRQMIINENAPMYPTKALKKAANIKDRRAELY